MNKRAALALAPMILLPLAGCGPTASTTPGTTASKPAATKEKQITYTVTADSGKASITYSSDGSGSTQQENATSLPWTYKTTLKPGFNVLTVIAQNSGSGKITCTISVDGKEVKTATSSGEYSIATCTTNVS